MVGGLNTVKFRDGLMHEPLALAAWFYVHVLLLFYCQEGARYNKSYSFSHG